MFALPSVHISAAVSRKNEVTMDMAGVIDPLPLAWLAEAEPWAEQEDEWPVVSTFSVTRPRKRLTALGMTISCAECRSPRFVHD